MPVTPYVVGQWVRGTKFYGRQVLIDEILHGHRNWLWLLGTRRIGKTSLLRQVEHLAATTPELGYVPIFWDFQGANESEELRLTFTDSLLEAEERLEEHGISVEDVEHDDLLRSLGNLRRKLRSKKLKLLLLCDEVEELVGLNEKDPGLLPKLRRAMQSAEDIRSVLASTIRLWALSSQRGDTSPFLHGFAPPLYIHNLTDDEARALIRQANLPSDSRPRIDEEGVEQIRERCDSHPYLIQLLSKRYLEMGDLDQAVEQVASDPMVSFFFSVDFEMLSQAERDVLTIIGEQRSSTSNSIQQRIPVNSSSLAGSLHRLEHLGYIRRNEHGRYVLVNYFFSRWFRELPTENRNLPAEDSPTVVVDRRDEALGTEVRLGTFDSRYELQEKIGRGATGVVYKALDRELRTLIAIKVLKPEYAAHEEAVERLRREVLLARDIAHPNIVKIYHLGSFRDRKYITMQWIDGPTLGEEISKEGRFQAEKTVSIGRRLAAALAAAHGRKVLHRDIKPNNILIDRDGEPHVSDFGLARLMGDPGLTSHGIFIGTPDYASPEQASLQDVDERSDIYALGVVLYEMATGHKPFKSDSTRKILQLHATAVPRNPRDLCSNVPVDLAGLIMRCLEKEPDDRFQTAGRLEQVLSEFDPGPG